MRPFATGGIYLNFIGDEGQDRVRAAYGETAYDRLAGIKAEYDPTTSSTATRTFVQPAEGTADEPWGSRVWGATFRGCAPVLDADQVARAPTLEP